MSRAWPVVSLGEAIAKSEEWIDLKPDEWYREVTVRLWGKGIVQRRVVTGAEIAASRRLVVRPQQFILSRIDARNGASGIVPDSLDGAIVSNDFPVFTPNPTRILPRFLGWMSKTPRFVDLCKAASEGTTNRVRLKEERFLATPIPLPPLSEQRRIVGRVEDLAAKIEEAKGLRREAVKEAEGMMASVTALLSSVSGNPVHSFGDVLIEAKNGIYKPPEYWGNGIPCIRMYNIEGPGMNTRQLQMLDVTSEEFAVFSCKPGDLIFNRVNSAELVGKTGLVTEDYPQCTFESKNMRLRVDRDKILPEYAAVVLNSCLTQEYYRQALKQQCGMATLNQGHVRSLPLQLPPTSEQRRIVTYLEGLKPKVDELKRLQAETGAELDAMLPSVLDRAFKGEM